MSYKQCSKYLIYNERTNTVISRTCHSCKKSKQYEITLSHIKMNKITIKHAYNEVPGTDNLTSL